MEHNGDSPGVLSAIQGLRERVDELERGLEQSVFLLKRQVELLEKYRGVFRDLYRRSSDLEKVCVGIATHIGMVEEEPEHEEGQSQNGQAQEG